MRRTGLSVGVLVSWVRENIQRKGLSWTLSRAFHNLLYYIYYKKIRKVSPTFSFRGVEHKYFSSFYNSPYTNERSVEVPIVMRFINEYEGKKILEIGNVLSHYYDFEHDIVDKYEQDKDVINEDIVSFESELEYDLIVSISTLEHVGWDEQPREDLKILKAIANMKRLCKNGGKIVVTLPFGHNPNLDRLLFGNALGFSSQNYMRRISNSNEWKEVSYDEAKASMACKVLVLQTERVNTVTVGILVNQK